MSVFVDVEGISGFQKFLQLAPEVATKAARLSINQTAQRQGLTLARKAMLEQVSWPAGYLNQESRFRVAATATDSRLEAIIVARQTPTSLARFTGLSASPARGTKLSVRINPGASRPLPRAFLIRLRSGNLGLGIRLREGETLLNSVGAKIIRSGPLAGVALLYGPSVDQVFRTVAVDVSPQVAAALQQEFIRQFIRLSTDA